MWRTSQGREWTSEQLIRKTVTRRVGSYKWSVGCLSGESDEDDLVDGGNEVFWIYLDEKMFCLFCVFLVLCRGAGEPRKGVQYSRIYLGELY